MASLGRSNVHRSGLIVGVSVLALTAGIFVAAAASPFGHQASPAHAQGPAANWQAVEQAMGKAGAVQSGDVYRVSLPRTDLQVTARGVAIQAPLALGSW